jgi:DNA-3-methyladenine glycosylase I
LLDNHELQRDLLVNQEFHWFHRSEWACVLQSDLKKRGFNFLGSTIVYAHMQAVGMVNDHLEACFRRASVAKLARRR